MPGIKVTLTKREKLLISVILLSVLAITGWHFVLAPLQATLAELLRERAVLKGEQARLTERLQQKESIVTAWSRWQTGKERLQAAVPTVDLLPQVLAQLEALLLQYPVEVHALKTGDLQGEAGFASLKIMLDLSGPAEQTLLLLEQLEQFTHLLIIDSVDCSRHEAETFRLKLNFRLIFFDPAARQGDWDLSGHGRCSAGVAPVPL